MIDITNEIAAPSHEATITGHEVLRKAACQDLQIYTDKMVNQMRKKNKRIVEYQVGDLVRVAIPKIDRFSTDRSTVPCKIIEKIEDKY